MSARPLSELRTKRLEKFVQSCKEACKTRKSFDKHFTIIKQHVFKRAAETISHLRHTLQTKENLAKVVRAGKLNIKNSKTEPVIEVAIEARFKILEWTDPGQVTGKMSGEEENVCVRVIIKEDRNSSIKKVIVTVYADNNIDPSTIPEVAEDEIW